DAEKVLVASDRLKRVSRAIEPRKAYGEYIGLAKFSPMGAALLREHYQREASSRPKAYLIELLDQMLDRGVEMATVDTAGDYFEVDTTEDYHLAQEHWRS